MSSCNVITNEDGSRETEKKHLRLIHLPKLNYKTNNVKRGGMSEEIEKSIQDIFNLFCKDGTHADP